MINDEICYRAVQSRDSRFDGMFVTAVRTTGIYCRPSCPARTPHRENVQFFRTAAAAQEAGFRACKRCRPDAAPGSPEWNARTDVAARAMRLIADGTVDREGVAGLAQRLHCSVRTLRRQLTAELGAGPLALARAQRAQTARILVETTNVAMGDVAFASGFSSLRQFNATVKEVFGAVPTELRARSRFALPGRCEGTLRLRLAYRPPLDFAGLLNFLRVRAVPGVEECDGDVYRRVLLLPHGLAVATLRVDPQCKRVAYGPAFVTCELDLQDLRDLPAAVQRCRRVLDLDADPQAVTGALGGDSVLGAYVRKAPGRRVPGYADENECAIRAVLGQQVSLAAARTLASRLAVRYGTPLAKPRGTLTHAFPAMDALAGADENDLAMPKSRRRAVLMLAAALASGDVSLDPGVDREEASARLLRLPGIGPWTVQYIRMRALSDPDAFLPSDLGVRHALERLGLPSDPASALRLAERWRPWRAYALQHLWALLESAPRAQGSAERNAETAAEGGRGA